MRIFFYKEAIHLILSGDEGALLYPVSEQTGRPFLGVTGTWSDGIRIYPSNERDYALRPDPNSSYYKPTFNGTAKKFATVAASWNSFGGLDKSAFNYPSRGSLEGKFIKEGNQRCLQFAPLSNLVREPDSPTVFTSAYFIKQKPRAELFETAVDKPSASPQIEQKPVVFPPTPKPPPILSGFKRGERIVETDFVVSVKQPVVEAPPPKPKVIEQPAVSVEPEVKAPVSVSESVDQKTIADLKNLALELNKALAAMPTLHLKITDGRWLSLEQEYVEFEEF